MSLRKLHPLATLALVFVLGWTSVAMSVVRLQAQAGMVVTLCTPAGLQTVVLGDDGAPPPHPHPCPYCVIIAAAALPQISGDVPRPEPPVRLVRQDRPNDPACEPARACLPEARAPPHLSI